MLMNITKWGNSLGVRIPRTLANKIGLQEGTPIDISVQDCHIVIKKSYSLESLLNQVTAENIHEETPTGHECGKEVW